MLARLALIYLEFLGSQSGGYNFVHRLPSQYRQVEEMEKIIERLAAGLNSGPLATLTTDVSHVAFGRLAPYILAGLAAYPVLCSCLRFRRMRSLHRKYNFPTRESLARMTDDEACEIQKVLLQLEFPFFFVKALQFALFRVSHCLIPVRRTSYGQSTKILNRRTAFPLYPGS